MADVLIIGGGPAGVAAANYARARGLEVILFEQHKIGGLITLTSTVSHYPGLDPQETGSSFGSKLNQQLQLNGTKIVTEKVTELKLNQDPKVAVAAGRSYEGKAVILATGSWSKTLTFSDSNDPSKTYTIAANAAENLEASRGKEVFVLGGSDGACKEAIKLSQYASKVHIVQTQDKILAISEFKDVILGNPKFEIHLSSELEKIEFNQEGIQQLWIKNHKTGEVISYHTGVYLAFAYIGQEPNHELFQETIELTEGYIQSQGVNTNIDGVFSCGDINAKSVRQISTAVAEGTLAGILAKGWIDKKENK